MRCSTLTDIVSDEAADDAFAARAVREVGKLFSGSESWLALIDGDGTIVSASSDARACARLEERLGAATVAQLRALLAESASDVRVVSGTTIGGAPIELRILRADPDSDSHLLFVRPVDAEADRAHGRVRELSAALQAVADIVIPIKELQGHEEARRRAALVAPLTERERRVALAVADGVRTSQIANDLFVSQSTIRNYLPSIYRKLGVGSRDDLVQLLASPD